MFYLYGLKDTAPRRLVATFGSGQQLLAYVRWATLSSGDKGSKFEQGSRSFQVLSSSTCFHSTGLGRSALLVPLGQRAGSDSRVLRRRPSLFATFGSEHRHEVRLNRTSTRQSAPGGSVRPGGRPRLGMREARASALGGQSVFGTELPPEARPSWLMTNLVARQASLHSAGGLGRRSGWERVGGVENRREPRQSWRLLPASWAGRRGGYHGGTSGPAACRSLCSNSSITSARPA